MDGVQHNQPCLCVFSSLIIFSRSSRCCFTKVSLTSGSPLTCSAYEKPDRERVATPRMLRRRMLPGSVYGVLGPEYRV